jgi:hypothetical protein
MLNLKSRHHPLLLLLLLLLLHPWVRTNGCHGISKKTQSSQKQDARMQDAFQEQPTLHLELQHEKSLQQQV